MASGRYSPTATVLKDGRVLVAGGYDGVTTVRTVQVFTPSANVPSAPGTWTAAGSLSYGRNFATATVLGDGQVLVAGGYNSSSGTIPYAELFNPATGTFSRLKNNMTGARELYTATKLPSGKVLLVGGFKTGYGGGTLRSAEIYDPATKRFTATCSMTAAGTPYGRFGHDALLFPGTSKVLIVGGKERRSSSDWRSLRSVEIYDAATGQFSYVGDMAYRRDRPTLAWVAALQKVLIVGGKSEAPGEPSSDVRETEWYDPATNALSANPGPSLAHGRMAHTLTFLPDSGFLVVGGWSENRTGEPTGAADGSRGTTATAERFVPDAANPLGGTFVSAGTTCFDTLDHASVALPDGRVLVVGGKQITDGATDRYPARAEIYIP